MLPAGLPVVGLVAYPFCYAPLSLTARRGVAGQRVGLRNFANHFGGDTFLQTIRNAFVFTGMMVVCKTIPVVEVLSVLRPAPPLVPMCLSRLRRRRSRIWSSFSRRSICVASWTRQCYAPTWIR